MDIETAKDEVSSLQSQTSKDEEAMEEEYYKALELIFSYGYECCAFKHNIYRGQPEVLDGMPDSSDPLPLEFFMNPKCRPARAPTKATVAEVDQSKAIKEPERSAPTSD